MNDRYFGKVVNALDKFTVVVNRGGNHGMKVGDKFLLVGLGELIIDPDTREELERLEIVRGKAVVTHVQDKISTLYSSELEKKSSQTEIKKVTSRGGGGIAAFLGTQDVTTESTKPGEERVKPFANVAIGDFLIKV